MQKSIHHRTVRDVMTRTPRTVRPNTDLRTLKTMFEMWEFNTFPVVDERDTLVGVVTRFDLLRMFRPDAERLFFPDVRASWAERVEDIMSRGPVTVHPDDSVLMVVDEMVRSKLQSLPVVERYERRNVLVGIVSRQDVLRCVALLPEGGDT
jgi:CBS domain-containing protein